MAEKLRHLYERLHQELGTDQFIFCQSIYKHWGQIEIRRLWVLELPTREVFRYMDSPMWEALFDRDFSKVSEEDAWRRLFLSEIDALSRIASEEAASVVPMLRVPIPDAWVCDCTKFNWGPHAPMNKRRYENLATSVDEARSYRQR